MAQVTVNYPTEITGFTIEVSVTEMEWLTSLAGAVDATNRECFDLFIALATALEDVGLYNYGRLRKLRQGMIPG